jgi:hypothetical protein
MAQGGKSKEGKNTGSGSRRGGGAHSAQERAARERGGCVQEEEIILTCTRKIEQEKGGGIVEEVEGGTSMFFWCTGDPIWGPPCTQGADVPHERTLANWRDQRSTEVPSGLTQPWWWTCFLFMLRTFCVCSAHICVFTQNLHRCIFIVSSRKTHTGAKFSANRDIPVPTKNRRKGGETSRREGRRNRRHWGPASCLCDHSDFIG